MESSVRVNGDLVPPSTHETTGLELVDMKEGEKDEQNLFSKKNMFSTDSSNFIHLRGKISPTH